MEEQKKDESKKTKHEGKVEKKIAKKLRERMEKLLKKQAGAEASTLKRMTGDAAQDKSRITFAARHNVGLKMKSLSMQEKPIRDMQGNLQAESLPPMCS